MAQVRYLNVTSINIFPKHISGQIPSVGGNEDPVDKEAAAEEEKLRQEAIKEAEEKRRVKHKKLEEERENMRQGIRDRVSFYLFTQLWLSQMVNISIKNVVEFHNASGEIQQNFIPQCTYSHYKKDTDFCNISII